MPFFIFNAEDTTKMSIIQGRIALATIIKNAGGWDDDYAQAAQDGDGMIHFYTAEKLEFFQSDDAWGFEAYGRDYARIGKTECVASYNSAVLQKHEYEMIVNKSMSMPIDAMLDEYKAQLDILKNMERDILAQKQKLNDIYGQIGASLAAREVYFR